MAVAPSEFPPPFDSESVIAAPTDLADERIEVGIAIVGGGPAGLACANKLMQLLEDEPELTEKLGEVPVAVIEKGKVAGAHLLSGANVDPSAMERLFPDLPPAEWPPVYQEVTKDATYFLTKSKAFPLKPPPPNFRKEGTYTMSVSKLGRFLAEKAEEAGVYILTETAATQLLVEDRIVKGVRSGDRGRGKEGQELGNFEPGSDVVAKATVLAEGTIGHLTYAAIGLLRPPRGLRPAGLGARGQGGLGGAAAAGPGHPHPRLAVALESALQGGRRQLHLPDGRGQGLLRPRRRPRQHRRHLLGPRRPAAVQDPPLHHEDHRGRQAGRLGREDDPLGRLLGAAEALLGAGHADRRRRRRDGQHRRTRGCPLRDARRHVRGGSDRRLAEEGRRLGQLRKLRRDDPQLGDREGPLPLAQHEAAADQGPDLRRRDG